MDSIWAHFHRAHQIAISLKETHGSTKFTPIIETVERLNSLARQYYEVSNSIYWRKAKTSLKRQTHRNLETIAWQVVEILETFPKIFNEWIEEQENLKSPCPQTATQLKFYIQFNTKNIEKYWGYHLKSKQLELFPNKDV